MSDTATKKIPEFLDEAPSGPKPAKAIITEKPKPIEREMLLEDSSHQISKEWPEVRGEASEFLDNVAAFWEPVVGVTLTVEQVAICLDLVNTATLIKSPGNREAWVNKISYSALGGELAQKEKA